ncbi:MAG: hypothetical protein QMD21_07890, partial [Candidatus Thermoplasmatota archaeon]|nr:hypothetical protein [Candidatus Thermoplasmatota archaeon]
AGIDSMWVGIGFVPGGRDMDIHLGRVLTPGLKFRYEYDFGTTTELALKVVAEREGKIVDETIRLLARNDPPLITCDVCGKIATQVCSECIWSGKGWLCDKCARKHNSPRVGMCGYTG